MELQVPFFLVAAKLLVKQKLLCLGTFLNVLSFLQHGKFWDISFVFPIHVQHNPSKIMYYFIGLFYVCVVMQKACLHVFSVPIHTCLHLHVIRAYLPIPSRINDSDMYLPYVLSMGVDGSIYKGTTSVYLCKIALIIRAFKTTECRWLIPACLGS